MKSHERLHYMDNIRAIALMLGIIYHASLAYSPFMANIWFTADSKNHAIFDTLSHWLHLFRMPVSFIIAGFFADHLIEKKVSSHFHLIGLKDSFYLYNLFPDISRVIFTRY